MRFGRAAVFMSCVLTGLVLLGAGCGSSPDRDNYISRGDAICKQTTAEQAKLTAPAKGNLPATARYLRAGADLIDKELTQLRKLSRPSGDRERLGDLLTREGDAIATLRRAADAATKGDQKTAEDLFTQGEGELSDVGAGLRDYGFNACGT
jgi:hypothetical protein